MFPELQYELVHSSWPLADVADRPCDTDCAVRGGGGGGDGGGEGDGGGDRLEHCQST